jgi:serine/threonine protein phosphatase PrpC
MDQPETSTGNGVLSAHAVLAKLSWALRSEPGEVRPHNEDCAGAYAPTTPDDVWDRGPLWVVADGLGGHAAGEVASRLTVDTMLATWSGGAPNAPAQSLRTAVRNANTAVVDAALEASKRGMGTTVTALTLAGREAVIAHVGDSRAYRVRGGECTQLTADHSRVGEMLRMKMITPEQAANHPARSMLTRSLGAQMTVQVDLVKDPIETGDVFVVCTDGLWDVVPRGDIAGVVAESAVAYEAADRLVELALRRGSADNVTCVVVRVSSDLPIPAAGPRRSFFRRGR